VGHPVAIAGFVFCWLALGCSSAHFWLDSGELAAAGASLGVMHPPGVPGFVPTLHVATLIPLGSLGFRMALASAFFAAWAVGTMASMMIRREVPASVIWVVCLWVAVGVTFARNGRVVEIYALGGFLAMATLWGFDPKAPRPHGPLLGTLAAVLGAWGFGDLRLAFAIPVAVIWARAAWRGEAWARWAPLLVVLASSAVLSLAVSAARDPILDWGDPDGLVRLWDHVQARSIRESFAERWFPASPAAWGKNLSRALALLADDLGPLGLAATGVAGFAWYRRRADRGQWTWVAWLIAVELFYAVAVNPMGVADRQTGVPLALTCGLVVGIGLRDAARGAGRYGWAVLPLGFSILVAPPLVSGLGELVVTRSWAPHAWTAGALEATPPGGLVLSTSDDLAAGLAASRALEAARPDVARVPSQHLYRPPPPGETPELREAWLAARQGCAPGVRVRTLIAAWRGQTLLEDPRDAGVDWRPAPRGLAVAAVGSDRPRVDVAAEARALSERWLEEMRSPQDRERLARAISTRVRALIEGRRTDLPMYRSSMMGLEMAIAIHPPGASARVALAAMMAGEGQHDAAQARLDEALRLEPDRRGALIKSARVALARGDSAMATSLSTRVTQLYPWSADAWRTHKFVCERTGGDCKQAEARLEALRDRAHERAAPHCRVGTEMPDDREPEATDGVK
jgi:hypothetical protein